jgi:hypothetical protein
MPWDNRRASPRYHRAYKKNDTCKSVCFGSGVVAQLAAQWFEANADMKIGVRDNKARDPLKADADILAHLEEASNLALHQLLACVSDDPMTRSRLFIQLLKIERRLAPPDASTLILLLARNIITYWAESNISNFLFYRQMCQKGGVTVSGSLAQWRLRANKRLLSAIKAYAWVQHCQESWVHNILSKVKVA